MPSKGSTPRVCQSCGNRFYPTTFQIQSGRGKYCSHPCYSQSLKTSPPQRFWSKVQKTETCWLWRGGVDKDGYGYFQPTPKSKTGAHRFSYQLHTGPIPSGFCVLHNCPEGDNPACVNPAHLWLGTHVDNVADKVAKGRAAIGDRNGQRLHPERTARGERQGNAKLTEEIVKELRARHALGISFADLGRTFGITPQAVRSVVMRRNWKHVL